MTTSAPDTTPLPALLPPAPPVPPPERPGMSEAELAELQRMRQARRAHRRRLREQGLPTGVWIARPLPDERYTLLRVRAPGQLELWHGGDHPVEQLVVQRVSRAFWRGARLTLTGVDGSRTVLKIAGPDVNPADLGEPEVATWRAVAGAMADSIGIVLVPLVVLALSPVLLVRTLRRRIARDALAARLSGR